MHSASPWAALCSIHPSRTSAAETTTTTAACPDNPSIKLSQSGAGDELEPDSYGVPLIYLRYSFTADDPTRVWLTERFELTGWRHIPDPAWQRPTTLYEALEFTTSTFVVAYNAESESELPVDPAAWLTAHLMLETTEPVPVTVDGYVGVQVDAVVLESHPDRNRRRLRRRCPLPQRSASTNPRMDDTIREARRSVAITP